MHRQHRSARSPSKAENRALFDAALAGQFAVVAVPALMLATVLVGSVAPIFVSWGTTTALMVAIFATVRPAPTQ